MKATATMKSLDVMLVMLYWFMSVNGKVYSNNYKLVKIGCPFVAYALISVYIFSPHFSSTLSGFSISYLVIIYIIMP